jgi:hypothetical protein
MKHIMMTLSALMITVGVLNAVVSTERKCTDGSQPSCTKYAGNTYPHSGNNWLETRTDGNYLCTCPWPTGLGDVVSSHSTGRAQSRLVPAHIPGGVGPVITSGLVFDALKKNKIFMKDLRRLNTTVDMLKNQVKQLDSNKYGVCIFVPTNGIQGGWVGCLKDLGRGGFKAWRIASPNGLHCFKHAGATLAPADYAALGQVTVNGYTCQVRVPKGSIVR